MQAVSNPITFQHGNVSAFLFATQPPSENNKNLYISTAKEKTCVAWEDLSRIELRVGTVAATRFISRSIKGIDCEMNVDFGSKGVHTLTLPNAFPGLHLEGVQIAAITNLKPQHILSYTDNRNYNFPLSLSAKIPNGTNWVPHPAHSKL